MPGRAYIHFHGFPGFLPGADKRRLGSGLAAFRRPGFFIHSFFCSVGRRRCRIRRCILCFRFCGLLIGCGCSIAVDIGSGCIPVTGLENRLLFLRFGCFLLFTRFCFYIIAGSRFFRFACRFFNNVNRRIRIVLRNFFCSRLIFRDRFCSSSGCLLRHYRKTRYEVQYHKEYQKGG